MIKKIKKAINTNCISPNRPSPDATVNIVSKIRVIKNDITAESLSPNPESRFEDKISINDGKIKKTEALIINNNATREIRIFLESFLSLKSLSPIIIITLD